MSYAAAGGWVGAVKSTLCRWLKREPLGRPELSGRVLELDELWTRTAAGWVEMKVIWDEKGRALGTFAGWEAAIDLAWQHGATAPVHVVSDGNRAIAAGLAMVYGREVPHQLCHFHLLREYRRYLGGAGWSEARRWARRTMARTGGAAERWRRKALREGLRHLQTGQGRFKTTSRLERQNREYRRREKMGTVWTPHNLLILLQKRGLINQTT